MPGMISYTQPLLGLVMIVKDEAHGIVDTLTEFLPFVDRVTIVDTGSADGTSTIVWSQLEAWLEAGKQRRYTLLHATFVDFSTSRNFALDEHGHASTFTIMPDCDYRLSGGSALREFLESRRDPAAFPEEVSGGYDVNLFWDDGMVGDFYLPLVLRAEARWRYVGKVHEVVTSPTAGQFPNVKIPGVKITKIPPAKSLAASAARWTRDRVLLEADLAEKPDDPRTLFYLAQTLECLGEHVAAERMYADRIRAGGWNEETYEALFRRAQILSRMAPWWIAMHAYLEAHAFCPSRAEPLYAIADYYHALKQWPIVYLFAARAAALPMPASTLFVNRAVYQWQAAERAAISAFHLELHASGKAFADQALAGKPDLAELVEIFVARCQWIDDKCAVDADAIAEIRGLRTEILRLRSRERTLLADVEALRAAAFLAAEE